MSEQQPRKRPKRNAAEPRRNKSGGKRKRKDSSGPASDDALGALLEKHEVTLAGLIVFCGLLLVVGVGVFCWGFFQGPVSRTTTTIMVVGGFISLLGVILFGINILNIGRCLELRKRGVRFRERGVTKEMLWTEIVHVETDRLDSTNLGAATVTSRGNSAAAPTGLLTKSEFTITLHSDSGDTIRLSSIFLRTVGDPKKLISTLNLRAGA